MAKGNKIVLLLVITALVLALGVAIVPASPVVAAAFLEVGPGKPYATIQAAINAANAKDTILVAPGVYEENITIDKSLTLKSSVNAEVTIIDALAVANHVVTIILDAEMVVFQGFTVTGGEAGIYAQIINKSKLTISQNIIHGNEYGIKLEVVNGKSTVTIWGNVIDDNAHYGIYTNKLHYRSMVTIGGANQAEANTISGHGSEGIYVEEVYWGSRLTIKGNVVKDNNRPGVTIDYVDYGSTVTIKKNGISNNSYEGIFIGSVGFDPVEDPDTYYSYFQQYGKSKIIIDENTIEFNGYSGINILHMDFASKLTIRGNDISGNGSEKGYRG